MPAVARKPAPPVAKRKPAGKPKVQPAVRGRAPKRAASAPYQPAKLEAARGVGLAPKVALGVAAAAILGVAGLALFTGERLETLQRGVERTTDAAVAAFGFGVDNVRVEGASPHTEAAVLAATGVEPGDSILGVNLEVLRGRVERVSWVHEVTVRRLLPNTLEIAVVERRPLAVWQYRGRIALVDAGGRVIADADAAQFPQLPLVVGAGAGQAAGEILPLLHARPKLMERVEALVRVDRRRWDVRLRDGALIQLPALDEGDALMRLDQLEQTAHVLALGFEKIDLRDPELVAVRPRANLPPRSVAEGAPATAAPQSATAVGAAPAAAPIASAPAPVPTAASPATPTPAAPAATGL